jgi:hypothetical protein
MDSETTKNAGAATDLGGIDISNIDPSKLDVNTIMDTAQRHSAQSSASRC